MSTHILQNNTRRAYCAAFGLLLAVSYLEGSPAAYAQKTKFDLRKDGFAFTNDVPSMDPSIGVAPPTRGVPAHFVHSCFIFCRSAAQFKKFATFAPGEPKVSEEEYRKRVKQIVRTPVWFREPATKVVIPGYRNLHEFSAAHTRLLEETLGSWLATYFRVGNWRLVFWFPRGGQALAAQRIASGLDQGKLQAVYAARFPHMNHCLLLYDYKPEPGGDIRFIGFDPNYVAEPTWLRYHAQSRTFDMQRRYYFAGGPVNIMRVYLSPFH